MAASRNRQPTFNLFTGEDGSAGAASTNPAPTDERADAPPAAQSIQRRSSTTFRKSALPVSTNGNGPAVRATIDNENIRAALHKLQYEHDTLKSDTALERETLLSETRELSRRCEAEHRRATEAERARDAATGRLDALAREGRDAAMKWDNERTVLERRTRELGEAVRVAREEVDEAGARAGAVAREADRERGEASDRVEALERRVAELVDGVEEARRGAEAAAARAKGAEARVAELEGEVVALRTSAGDGEMLGVVKRELGEQVAYVKKLERSNKELEREVTRYTRERKAVEVVEEEKRTLLGKLGLLDGVRRELAESELRRQVLEDERRAWSSYLAAEEGASQGGFESPEELARAFVRERAERVQLLDKLGEMQPALAVLEQTVAALDKDKTRLESELRKLKASSGLESTGAGGEAKTRARVERQRNLAVKEVEYLRAQLKSLEDETTEFDQNKPDDASAGRVAELEHLVDEYKTELATLHAQLSQLETQPPAAATQPEVKPSLKRSHDDASSDKENEQLGTLQRKLRKLSDSLSSLEAANKSLHAELGASQSQTASLRESLRTRVLSLHSNPTAQHEATKLATLRLLQAENAALLATQLGGSRGDVATMVPRASLDALQGRLADKDAELAQRDKKALRMKTIWAAKAREFTDAIASTLGWNVTFLPQGKLKLSSVYYPTSSAPEGKDGEEEEEEENFILFDGDKGTMKISGGERSRFARELRGMVEFWVEERGEVPCFLAAASLEFLERRTNAAAAAKSGAVATR